MAETARFLLTAILFSLALFGAAALLTGCMSVKELECLARDNTSRPCN
jgi:energy-converting hydrogenase Eha subunit H